MTGLTIYKASAGSGKTFKLTLHYLKMLLKNEFVYKKVLAVTFTNKATAEMKNRILDELNNLANNKESKYRAILLKELNLEKDQITSRAQKAINNILHDYSRFSVSTIDNFFQKVIRTFTREIGLQSGYTLETDDDEILNYVVDELILDTEEDKKLKEWLVEFARARMLDAKSWNFRDEILDLARELSKESVKALDFLKNENNEHTGEMNNFVRILKDRMHVFEEKLRGFGAEGVKAIEQNGLTVNDFNNKTKGVAQYFYYLKNVRKDKLGPNKNARNVIDKIEKWPSGKLDDSDKERVRKLASDKLNDLLLKAANYYDEHILEYKTVSEIYKNVYVLGILENIQKRMRDYCKEKNLFLISDAAELLRKIIQNNEAPFIYEKTGSVYNHFMIDEFQDNSRFQWQNFRPLIRESLSKNGSNLVVGDIKQSIYRWRNGDWEILDHEVEKEFQNFPVEVQTLDHNFRSNLNVIAYNNTIFHFLPGVLQNHFDSDLESQKASNNWEGRIEKAYRDVMQGIGQEKKGGYISHRFMTYESSQHQEIKDKAKEQLIHDIEKLQDVGYKLSDIAIVVRKNTEGQEIANTLLEYKNNTSRPSKYKYDVISNDSLYLKNAESIRFLLAILNYFIDPEDDINNTLIKESYVRNILQNEYKPDDFHTLFKVDPKSFKEIMPDVFFDNFDRLKRMPLFDLTEEIIRLFDLNTLNNEIPYIQAFQDLVMDFTTNNAADLNTFLEWWKKNGSKEKLQLPERNEAIRIITIHKAKGLEFKAVLIPFCYWEIDETSGGFKKNYLWCKPQREKLNGVTAVPVNYKSALQETDFKEDYLREKFHNYVDNLNLLYVAFTRAEEVLISYSPLKLNSKGEVNYKKSKNGLSTVGELLYYFFEQCENYPKPGTEGKPFIGNLKDFWDPVDLKFVYGSLKAPERDEEKKGNIIPVTHYPVSQRKTEVRFQKNHQNFFAEKADLFQERIDYGKIMHQIFEKILRIEDVPVAIDIAYREGKIDKDEGEELKKEIENLLAGPEVNKWFSSSWEVYTEKDILLPKGKIYRPDRIMIGEKQTIVVDYKFGEKHRKTYENQMKRYLHQMKEMNYPNPLGYLWYVSQNEIIEVKL
jgi:ATP-dependent exoDNAse (exonuclease V) beta subunit